MTEEINSQDTGINVDNLDAGTDMGEQGEVAETKTKKSNVAKILAEKNAAKKRVEELEAQLKNQEFGEDKVQALIEQAILKTKQEEYINQTKGEAISIYGEEKLDEIEAVRAEHPTLSYTDAAKLAGLEQVTTSDPNRMSFAGNTPSSFRQQKTVKDMSEDDLRAGAEAEMKAMLGMG